MVESTTLGAPNAAFDGAQESRRKKGLVVTLAIVDEDHSARPREGSRRVDRLLPSGVGPGASLRRIHHHNIPSMRLHRAWQLVLQVELWPHAPLGAERRFGCTERALRVPSHVRL